jgi:hypothetical protein
MLRTDRDEATKHQSKTLSEEPRRAIPYPLKLEPKRAMLRRLTAEPVETQSTREIIDPIRNIPYTLSEEEMRRKVLILKLLPKWQ